MWTTMRTMLVVGLVLVLLVLALPALGSTNELESGVIVIDGDSLAPARTSAKTIAYVEEIYPPAATPGNHGGGVNIAD